MSTGKRVLLVGEANPWGADPEFALYPAPDGTAGERLCRLIMGLPRAEYLRRFERANLCPTKWSAPVARASAAAISARLDGGDLDVAVLLGRKVAEAFGAQDFAPFTHVGKLVLLPHPSGLNRVWNMRGSFDKARATLVAGGALPALVSLPPLPGPPPTAVP